MDIGHPEHDRSPPVVVGGPVTSTEGPSTPAGGPLVSLKEPKCRSEGLLISCRASCIGHRPTVSARGPSISARRLSVADKGPPALATEHRASAGEPPTSARCPLSARGPSVWVTGPLYLALGLLVPISVLETPALTRRLLLRLLRLMRLPEGILCQEEDFLCRLEGLINQTVISCACQSSSCFCQNAGKRQEDLLCRLQVLLYPPEEGLLHHARGEHVSPS